MATNPILNELANLSPGAKAALHQAHGAAMQQAQAPPKLMTDPSAQQLPPAVGPHPAPAGPPPMPASLTGNPAPTKLSSIAPPPTDNAMPLAPRGTVQAAQNEQSRLLNTGSGIHQIKNPFLKGLAEVGNTIGHFAAPGLMTAIPGTEEHHQSLLNQNAKEIGLLQGQRAKDTANELQQAQTQEAGARTENLENPPDTVQPLTTDQGIFALHTHGGEATPLNGPTGEPLQAPHKQFNETPEEKAFDAAVKGGMQPIDAYRAIKDASNLKDPSLQQQYLDALASGDTKKMQAIASTIRATSTQPKIEIREAGAAAGRNKQRDAATEREYSAAAKDLNTQFSTAQTQLESAQEAQSLINSGAIGQALGVVKTMVALAGGKGSGVRITQAELNSIANARGIQGNFEGWLNKLSGKGNLSAEQIRQVNAVLADASARLQQKRQGLSDTLDRLGDATSPQDVRHILSEYRHQSMGEGQPTHTVSLKAAMALPQNKGKSEADVRKDIEAHGYQVGQ